MFRTLKRWFSTDETKHLAQDVDKALTQLTDLGIRIEGLQRRVDLHLHKLQMRDARDARGGTMRRPGVMELSEEEEQILADIRARNVAVGAHDPFA